MDKDWAHYLNKHTRMVTAVVVAVFLLLAAGEYYLYRKVQYLNQMVAEGVMQIKEEINKRPVDFNQETN